MNATDPLEGTRCRFRSANGHVLTQMALPSLRIYIMEKFGLNSSETTTDELESTRFSYTP